MTTTSVGSLKSDAFADGVSKFAGTLDDDGEVSLTFADSVTGYSSEEDDDTVTVSSVKVSAEQLAWTRDWGPAVVKLIQDKGILGTGNREFADRFEGGKARFKGQKDEFVELGEAFVKSLHDFSEPSQSAYEILKQMTLLFTPERQDVPRKSTPNAHWVQTNWPSNTTKCALEYINAKRLWKAGYTSLLPGPGVAVAGEGEPDYDVRDKLRTAHVGDHLRLSHAEKGLQLAICDNAWSKVETYNKGGMNRLVDVVLDVSEIDGILKVNMESLTKSLHEAVTQDSLLKDKLNRIYLVTPKVHLVYEKE